MSVPNANDLNIDTFPHILYISLSGTHAYVQVADTSDQVYHIVFSELRL